MESAEDDDSKGPREHDHVALDKTIDELEACLTTLDRLGVREGTAELDLAIHKLRDYRAMRQAEPQ